MITDYFGARTEAAKQKNWDYIGYQNERNRVIPRNILDNKKDAYEQKKRWLNRRWNDDDRIAAINMYKQGYRPGEIATYLDRDAGRVFDELQPLIVKDILGVKNVASRNSHTRAIPKVDLSDVMATKKNTEWQVVLSTSNDYCRSLRGTRTEKDVPAAVAINMALYLRRPVDTLFDFFKK